MLGRNKQHIQKNTIVTEINKKNRNKYKTRTKVETFFGNIQRYPCIINVYEKTKKSYEGLFMFALCISLAKKINKIIAIKNNDELKKEQEIKLQQKKEYALKRIKEKKKLKEEYDRKKKLEQNKREKIKQEIINKINEKIKKNINTKYIDSIYDKFKKK